MRPTAVSNSVAVSYFAAIHGDMANHSVELILASNIATDATTSVLCRVLCRGQALFRQRTPRSVASG